MMKMSRLHWKLGAMQRKEKKNEELKERTWLRDGKGRGGK